MPSPIEVVNYSKLGWKKKSEFHGKLLLVPIKLVFALPRSENSFLPLISKLLLSFFALPPFLGTHLSSLFLFSSQPFLSSSSSLPQLLSFSTILLHLPTAPNSSPSPSPTPLRYLFLFHKFAFNRIVIPL